MFDLGSPESRTERSRRSETFKPGHGRSGRFAICRLIATAGKHFKVIHHPDPTVRATYAEDNDDTRRFELVIYDGQEEHDPHHICVRALLFWKLALGWLEM